MGKLKQFLKKNRLKESVVRPQKQRLRYIAILPSLITLLNGIAGFIAISYTSRAASLERPLTHRFGLTFFALAGYMVFLAMIADMLDGRVARLSKSTSSFGGQLDSLSDAISFGVAPAFLMMKVLELKVRALSFPSLFFQGLVLRGIGFCALVYLCGTVIRLARFNVENEEDESAHMYFSGLPSPAAAGVVVSLVVFQQDFLPRFLGKNEALFSLVDSIFHLILPIATLIAAILMVSRIRYPHLVNVYFKGKKPFSSFIWASLVVLFTLWNLQLAAVVGFCGFAFGGAVRGLIVHLKHKRERLEESLQPTSVNTEVDPAQKE
ncbi:MAG: phosphatidylcholine/phosphatidylserine synthase [Spirochaetales bacterium]